MREMQIKQSDKIIGKIILVSSLTILVCLPLPTGFRLLDTFILLFNGFFNYPFVILHEFGHVIIFFIFYQGMQSIILDPTGYPSGYVAAMNYIHDFPTSFIALGGLFVNLCFLSLFAFFLKRQEFMKHLKEVSLIIRDKNKKIEPLFSLGEYYCFSGLLVNLGHFINSLLPFAFDATGEPSLNDTYQFLRANGIDSLDLSLGGITPYVISILVIIGNFFAWYFVISGLFLLIQKIDIKNRFKMLNRRL